MCIKNVYWGIYGKESRPSHANRFREIIIWRCCFVYRNVWGCGFSCIDNVCLLWRRLVRQDIKKHLHQAPYSAKLHAPRINRQVARDKTGTAVIAF